MKFHHRWMYYHGLIAQFLYTQVYGSQPSGQTPVVTHRCSHATASPTSYNHTFVTGGCRTGHGIQRTPPRKREHKSIVHATDVYTITRWKENRSTPGKSTLITQL